ncbi:MAG: hypothetical protein HQ567_05055, partial [Candidatus Nealsonbacteria bacterium]|nr:hypothetical protein [Candidatus Nealsonbacteria bacterium]
AFSKALDIAVHEDSGLVINAIGGATLGSLTLNNGALSVTGDVTFSSTTAPAGATSAGVGGDGSVMGGDLTIASNAFTLLVPGSGTVTYDSISIPGTATALTLDVDATMTPVVITANGGSPAVTITKAGASTLTMAEPNVNLENASWAVSGGTLDVDVTTADPLAGAPVTLAGGTLRISTTAYDPNSMVPNVVDYAFYDNVVNTELAAIDDGIDNNQNGGLLNLEPTSTQKWTGEIWQQGNMSDTYHQVWSGLFTAPKTGTYEFYVHGDDYEMLWIDKNGDGEFDNTQENEAVTANPHTDGWNTPKTGTIDLVAGQSYDFALGHNEGGGGDFLNATIKIPDGAAVRMNPSDPAQAGWWATRGGTVAISVTSTITVDNPVAVGGSNTVKLAFYDNVASSELAAIDDGVDNGLNGGLLLLDPTSTEAWDGAIWQGANFSDTYHKVWSGSFTAPETGTYTFNVHGDDYEMFLIDKNRDGEFDGAEETVTSNPHDDPDGWNTPRTGTIELVAGQSYDFALGLNEVGGNDFLNATIQTPTGSAVRMNPSDPAQDGWWSAPIEYGTSTLDINTETASTIDQIILKQGGLAIAGAPVTVGQASISTDTIGIVGLITHTPTVLTGTAGLQGNDQTVVLTKSGAADLVLNRAGVGLDNATIAVNGGSLVSQAAAGANPLGGAALALNGGTFVASATSAATSPVTYGNAISVDSDSALSAAAGTGGHAGPMTVNVTGPVTLDAQLNLSAGDNYELNFLSPVTGDGGLLIQDGTVAVSGAGVTLSSLEVAGGTASLIGENLTVGAMTLSGGVASTAVAGVRITGSMEIPGTGTISAMAGDFSVIGSDLAAVTGTVQLNGNVLFEGPASGTARFIRVWKNVSGLLHIGEIEAFVNGEVPDGAGSGGLSANDMALGTLGASHYINVATPDVSTTTNLQHGDPVRVYNALIETGANTWSTNNVQGMYVLDLGQAQPLSQIRVWQRGDCCEVRLENFTVSVLADDGGAPGEVLWSESYPGQAPRPGFAEFSFPTIAMEASAAEVNHLTGAGTVDGLIDVLGTIGPGVGGIGTITVGNAELGIDSGATFIAEVSVAAEVGDADKIVLAGGDSALMLGGELNVSSANDRTANDFFSAHATRTIVSNPIGSGGSIGWFDNVTDPQNPVMVGNRFDTVNPPLAAPGEPSPHIGEGAFLQGVDYVIPFGNITSSVELDVFIALGGDADGDGKVWLSDWAALRANFGNTGTGKTWTEGN